MEWEPPSDNGGADLVAYRCYPLDSCLEGKLIKFILFLYDEDAESVQGLAPTSLPGEYVVEFLCPRVIHSSRFIHVSCW